MLCLQLYRILFGDISIAETQESIRLKRDTDILPELNDELTEQLSEIADFSGTKTSMLDDLTGTSMSLLDHVLTAGHISADGIIFQLIRDNPKLLLNPEIRQLVIRMLEAAGRHEMDSFS